MNTLSVCEPDNHKINIYYRCLDSGHSSDFLESKNQRLCCSLLAMAWDIILDGKCTRNMSILIIQCTALGEYTTWYVFFRVEFN